MNKDIAINKHLIGKDNPVFIIAEAGVNHNGDLSLAKKMIDTAASAGADAIKFQTFRADKLVTISAPKAKYQKSSDRDESQFAMLKKLELSNLNFKCLLSYCKRRKITFLSTPFDHESAEFLCQLGVKAFKISSGDLTDIPLLRRIAGYNKPIILSTGMATMKEVREAVRAVRFAGNEQIILLHCTSNYPAKYTDVNLNAIKTMNKELKLPVGYSDHTEGIEVSIAAVAMGACIIEKHFTLDKNFSGPDHKASLDPGELKTMVASIRNIEAAYGNGLKRPGISENDMKKVARKSIVLKQDTPKGVKLSLEMLAVKRPGTGIAPKYLSRLVGKKAKRKINADAVLKWDLVS